MTNNDISKVYVGVSEVDKIYLGDALIYPTTPPPEPDYSLMPLTFEILSDGDIKWVSTTSASTSAKTIEYNLNDSGWTSITSTTGESAPTISVHSGDTIQFRGDNVQYGHSSSYYNFFSGSAQFNAYGNIMSLIDSTGYTSMVGFPTNDWWVFGRMFLKNQGIISAENLVLPVTAFSGNNAYGYMFASATSLTLPPKILPATELKDSCYSNMFRGCTSLTKAPELPATVLTPSCYTNMFRNCSNLSYIKCMATEITITSSTTSWVNGVASAGTFVKDIKMNDWTIGVNGIPTDWVVEDAGEPAYSAIPLTFEIISGGTITFTKSHPNMEDRLLYYSTDNFETWSNLQTDGAINVNAGDKIEFKSDFPAYGTSTYYTHFGGTAIFKAYGNIMSLVDNVGYETATILVSGFTFRDLFNGCSGLTDASNLILPATTLQVACYRQMFYGCSNLVAGPELPATTLAQSCYNTMFENCTSLTQAPELPATTLADSCYYNMFWNCTSLTQAPELPATSLAQSCYYAMFYGCTSLTTAPELPATTLTNFCYQQMFDGCSNLNYIKCLATDISASSSTASWVNGVASAGTFVKNANMNDWATGRGGIPENWTVVDAS